jgi:hypothetical protein
MPAAPTGAGVVAGLVGLAAAWYWQRRAQARYVARRAGVFADCREVFSESEVASPGSDYPLLRGRYHGDRVLLQPLLDHVGYRKVPSLWLVLTLDRQLAVGGKVDILFRPANIEFFSNVDQLPERIHLGPEWPEHHMARVGPSGWQPPLASMRAALGEAMDSSDLKEVVVTPRGVRLVVRVCGVERSHYMVLRSMLPEVDRIPADWLAYWLDVATELAAAVSHDVGETA